MSSAPWCAWLLKKFHKASHEFKLDGQSSDVRTICHSKLPDDTMKRCLTCCPGTPWWAAGRYRRPGRRCWRSPRWRCLSPEPGCLPSASRSPRCEVGSLGSRRRWKEWRRDRGKKRLCCCCFNFSLPDRENPAEVVHDVVEFHLQVFQDLAGLLTQLRNGHRNTHSGQLVDCEESKWHGEQTWSPGVKKQNKTHTSLPPMASNIFSSWTLSCWMLLIRMQGCTQKR